MIIIIIEFLYNFEPYYNTLLGLFYSLIYSSIVLIILIFILKYNMEIFSFDFLLDPVDLKFTAE